MGCSVPRARVVLPRHRQLVLALPGLVGVGIVLAASIGLFAFSVADGSVALQVFTTLVGVVSVSCTYVVWWRRSLPLWHKAIWTLVLMIPASGHLYFFAFDRVRSRSL
jgi:hypothetical protein